MLIKNKILLPVITLLSCAATVIAEEKNSREDSYVSAAFEAKTEFLTDSSVGVSELDQNTEESGDAWQVTVSPSVEFTPNEVYKLTASYDWSRKEYSKEAQEQFNLDLGSLHFDGSAKVKGFTVGGRYDRSDADLNKEEFLTLTQNTIYLARLIDQRWYWRASVIAKDKHFPGREARDAKSDGGRIDLFAFVNNMKVIWAFGLALEDEDAKDELLDYRGLSANASLTRKFMLFGSKSEVKLGYRYRENDYANYDLQILAERLDKNHQASLGLKIQTLENMAVIAELVKRDQSSNLSSADYDEVVASAGLMFTF